jgi:subtilisin family serine protease/subtilisin-like proprotein convertase family protein
MRRNVLLLVLKGIFLLQFGVLVFGKEEHYHDWTATTTSSSRITSSTAPQFIRRTIIQEEHDLSQINNRRNVQEGDELPDLSCNVYSDFCPTRFNGVCDRTSSSSTTSTSTADPACQGNGADCFDCDECRQFRADCSGCLAHNCVWCPGDATCFNSDLYLLVNRDASCVNPGDFTQLTCRGDSPGNSDDVFEDPLYAAQAWVYRMIQLETVWTDKGYRGDGVRVRINDNGVDVNHPEFEGRIDLEASCTKHYLPFIATTIAVDTTDGDNNNESPDTPNTSASHGTSVAGIVGAAANNNVCSVGIAPKVTLSSCNVFDSTNDDPYQFLDASQIQLYDIAQNSFGENPCAPRSGQRTLQQQEEECPFTNVAQQQSQQSNVPFPCDYCFLNNNDNSSEQARSSICEASIISHCKQYWEQDKEACLDFLDLLVKDGSCFYSSSLPTAIRIGLTRAILDGRQGKGILFVAAAGNTYAVGGDTNMGGYANSRFVLSVGAVGKDGKHASYSVPGASLFLSAPGGDHSSVASHVTAGLSNGSNMCRDAGVGTSFACPVVSGVVALILEANPDLTWRDVQEILAITSSQPEDDDTYKDTTAIVNAAGYWHSNYYGFGIVNANAAVEAAENWSLIGPEQMLTQYSGRINLQLLDDPAVVTSSTITMTEASKNKNNGRFRIQSVQVLLELEHFSRGQLQIALTSPQGTRSILHPGKRPENTQIDLDGGARWKFLTLKAWGESPFAEPNTDGTTTDDAGWTLELIDLQAGDISTDCVDSDWSIDRSHLGDGELDPITCRFLENIGACMDGLINPLGVVSDSDMNILMNQYRDEDGTRAGQTCCACGGPGVSRQEVTDQLRQWTLVVYGYYEVDGDDEAAVETPVPTVSPTTSEPASRPTSTPTVDPRTLMPSIDSTLVPVVAVEDEDDSTTTISTRAPSTVVVDEEDEDDGSLPYFVFPSSSTTTPPEETEEEDDSDGFRDKILDLFSAGSSNKNPRTTTTTWLLVASLIGATTSSLLIASLG